MRMSGNPQEVVQAYLKELLVSGSLPANDTSAPISTTGATATSRLACNASAPGRGFPATACSPAAGRRWWYPVSAATLLGVWIE